MQDSRDGMAPPTISARPPIIIKGGSLTVWSPDGKHLKRQGSSKIYWLEGNGSPLRVELQGFSDELPDDEDWDGIGFIFLELAAGGKLSIKINQEPQLVIYEPGEVFDEDAKKYRYPRTPKVTSLTGRYPNSQPAFGPFKGSDLKFLMRLE